MENQKTEWKESWRDEYMRTICAFANAAGGVLEIGRRDDGEIIGVPGVEKLLEDLPNKVKNAMAIIPDVEVREAGGKQYIAITTGAYPFPISYRGVYYIRSGSTTQELTGAALDGFMLRKQGKTWDGVPVPFVDLDDFESDAFKAFRRKAIGSARLTAKDLEITDETLLRNLQLIEGKYIKRAALLVFHQEPENWVPGAYIKIGFFANAADLIHQDEIHGPLLTMADKAEDLVYLKYFRGIISYQGMQRIETYPVPRTAFREAVLNAVIHKDYSTGNPIHIHIYPDKVLIYNDGSLPENWTEADLFAPHTSKPYNPLIANAFFRSGQIEAWGRGVQKIAAARRYWGQPEPFYRIRSNEVMIGFDAEVGSVMNDGRGGVNGGIGADGGVIGTVNGANGGVNDAGFGVIGADGTEKFGVNDAKFGVNGGIGTEKFGVNETQERIMDIMRLNPSVSAKSIGEEIGITTRGVEKCIFALKKLGLVERIGADKNGLWVVKGGD